ncbi:flavodoxin family protein [Alteribacter populi]|uniref:flavodoxin family protein n=1 Tax=Alteribacter populi TaxID=2011011 RepID=UPI000BBAC4C8|nr:flavodoxin family protein [Alteribacter populi]
MSIVVINGGSRKKGNTRVLTERAVRGLEANTINLADYIIKPVEDGRHSPEGFPDVKDDYREVINRMMHHDILVFATPIYWFSMTGTMKNFIDRWSQTMREPEYRNFRERMALKKAFVIAVGGASPRIKGLPLIQQFKHIFDFVHIPFEDYIIGHANKPGEIENDYQALVSADQLNVKLNNLTCKVKDKVLGYET